MPKDAVYINRLVKKGSEDYLLLEEERYILTIKSPFGTHSSWNLGHAQFKEFIEKYGLVPKWYVWKAEEKTTKDGRKYNKLNEIESDMQPKSQAKLEE